MNAQIQIAHAVVDLLNDGDFSESFEAVRSYAPKWTVQELETLRVTVVPRSFVSELATRKADRIDYGIDVGVQRRTDESLEDLDAAMSLVEQMVNELRRHVVAISTTDEDVNAMLVSLQVDPVFAPEHIADKRVFTAVIRLTYRSQQ